MKLVAVIIYLPIAKEIDLSSPYSTGTIYRYSALIEGSLKSIGFGAIVR